jgi:multidrug resistance efflux pump
MAKNLTALLSDEKKIADELAKARIKLTGLEHSEKWDALDEARRNVKELEESLEKVKEALKEELGDITMREQTTHYYSVYRELANEINRWISRTRNQFITEYLKQKYGIDYADVSMQRTDLKKTDKIAQLQETLQEGFERIREAQPKIEEAKRDANRRLLAIVKPEVLKIASRLSRYQIITDEDKNRLALEAEKKVLNYQTKLEKRN